MNRPEMIPVQSSNILAIGYDSTLHIVWIDFLNGTTYVYHEVNEEMYNSLKDAPSKGTFFNRYFKNNFAYNRYC